MTLFRSGETFMSDCSPAQDHSQRGTMRSDYMDMPEDDRTIEMEIALGLYDVKSEVALKRAMPSVPIVDADETRDESKSKANRLSIVQIDKLGDAAMTEMGAFSGNITPATTTSLGQMF